MQKMIAEHTAASGRDGVRVTMRAVETVVSPETGSVYSIEVDVESADGAKQQLRSEILAQTSSLDKTIRAAKGAILQRGHEKSLRDTLTEIELRVYAEVISRIYARLPEAIKNWGSVTALTSRGQEIVVHDSSDYPEDLRGQKRYLKACRVYSALCAVRRNYTSLPVKMADHLEQVLVTACPDWIEPAICDVVAQRAVFGELRFDSKGWPLPSSRDE